MKRLLFIIGIVIIIILTGILLFLLFASDSQKKDIFNAFNIGNTTTGDTTLDGIIDSIIPGDNTKLAALRQLTIKRVAGAIEIKPTGSSTEPIIYYAEAGTGHVYSLNIINGQENRLSNITIPTAQKAALSSDGKYAVIATDSNAEGRTITIVTLPREGTELASDQLSELVKEFTITSDDMVIYTTVTADTLTGRVYNPDKKETRTLFTLPFKEATVRFGERSTDSMYAYPKTALSLEGYLYEINGGVVQRLPISGYGLGALSTNNTILYSVYKDGVYKSFLYNITSKSSLQTPVAVIPEKCLFLTEKIFCGTSSSQDLDPESWYKGTKIISDILQLSDVSSADNQVVSVPQNEVGRDIDIINLTSSNDNVRLYFNNKIDGSLWIFDQSLSAVQ